MPTKPRRMSAAREARKRWLAIVGIGLFLAVDILLVALALQSTAPQVNGSASAETSGTSTPAPSETPTPTSSPTVLPTAPSRLIAALDASVVWRTTIGSCADGSAVAELSVDGGDTWTSRDLTSSTGITALQRILVSGSDTATFVGADADCTPDAVRTFVAGADFAEYPDQLESGWYLSPVGGATVHGPNGDVAAPCSSALIVAPLDAERAGVLCADGSLHVTTDAGTTWTALSSLDQTIALTETADGFLAASVGSADCAGVLLTTIGLEDDRAELGCVESSEPAESLAGATAIDWTEDGLWMWVDDRLLISTDEGETWT